jgi:hypothetical protein
MKPLLSSRRVASTTSWLRTRFGSLAVSSDLINDALHAGEISYALWMIQPACEVIHSSLIPSLAQTVCGPYQPFRVFTIGPTIIEFDSFFPRPSSSSVPGQKEALALRPYSLAESDSHAACAAILLSSGTTRRPQSRHDVPFQPGGRLPPAPFRQSTQLA